MPYIWFPDEADIFPRLARIEEKLDRLVRAEHRMEIEMALDFTKMAAAAAKQADTTHSVLAYIAESNTQLTVIRQQLADAITANDPAATAAAQKALDDYAIGMDTNDDSIAAAIATPGPVTTPPADGPPVVALMGRRR